MRRIQRVVRSRAQALSRILLCGASAGAMLAGGAAHAGSYSASDEASLKTAIAQANADLDPTATITLTGDITVADPGTIPVLSRPITIDTGTFTLSGPDGATLGGSPTFQGGALILEGATLGGQPTTTTGLVTAGAGLIYSNGSIENRGQVSGAAGPTRTLVAPSSGSIGGEGMRLTGADLVNFGGILGGRGGDLTDPGGVGGIVPAPGGGVGVVLNAGSLDNRGVIRGGDGGAILNLAGNHRGGVGRSAVSASNSAIVRNNGDMFGGNGGAGGTPTGQAVGGDGVALQTAASLINNANITAGAGAGGGAGGTGVRNSGGGSIENNGTILGGAASGSAGGVGISISSLGATITNTSAGVIEGGASASSPGGAGVQTALLSITGASTVINAGVIRGGAGTTQGFAVHFQDNSLANALELHPGSVIEGIVQAHAANPNEILRLGGPGQGSFDLAGIGGTAQYRNFNVFQKTGPGAWTLTGTTTAVPRWDVQAGTLLVNGDLSAATQATTVASGATLGGSGIIGGGVTVASGGFLAPGNSPGTLTINGPLVLNSGSILNMEFGAADAPGDPRNDLIVVNGALTLDGTINVAQSAGGTFGNGLYRIIDYTGPLTDNGLDVGALPAGAATVQTSVANQVNLIVTGVPSPGPGPGPGPGPAPDPPPTFTFWDGSGGTAADGVITGGAGVWTRNGAAWTDAAGTVNGAYSEPAFAIFGGTGGAVTVEDAGGPIGATGLQFAADGYRLTGGAIALGTPEATIRVGDGTAAGAGFTAVIASELTGVTRVVKDDLGTLVLTGANTYAGGTTIAAGTLQIGDGGTSGSIQGDVANEGRLVFDRSDAVTFAGAISGSGSLRQAGAGALVLTADSTYAGGTTISAGTLQLGDGGTTGSVQGDIVNNGALVFDRSNAMTLAGTISGSGSVRQAGAGTTVLTGANTYAGGTTIAAGALQLGDGGTSGSITGDVANAGTLAFNRADAVAFSGLISGSGAVRQMGTGTVTLGAANTYAGGTTIAGGTLRGTAASFGSGAIQNDGALVIDQAADATFANALNGAGTFTKLGAGRLTYAGAGTLAGPTEVQAGVLAVNGALGASTVTVRGGAGLAGAGSVGGVGLDAGAVVAPGDNGIGALTVGGGFAQAAGAAYQVQIDPAAGASDRIVAAGAATLAPGAVLNVSRVGGGTYRVGQSFVVLSAAGGVAGTYTLTGETGALSAFLGLDDAYDANNVYLTVEQVRALADASQTPNQAAAATGADSLAEDSALRTALVNLADDPAARAAFDQISGEAHASGQAVLVQQSGMIRDAAMARLSSCDGQEPAAGDAACDRPAGWAQVFGGWGKLDGDGNAAQVDPSSAGFLLGMDAPLSGWRLGAFAGYTRSDWDVDDRASKGESQDYHLGAYAGRELGGLSLRVGGALAWHEIDADRTVAFPGLSQSLEGGYDARTAQAFADLAYSLPAGGFDWSPFVNVAHVRLRTDGFTETGGSAALSAEAETMRQTVATLGVRPSARLDLGGAEARLRASLGWRHAFGDVTPRTRVAFEDGETFAVTGAALARDAAVVDVRLELPFGARGMAGVSYGGQYSGKATEHRLRADLRVRF